MLNIFNYSDHLLFIKNAFELKRSSKNRPPSLRSIAKKIELSPAYLSKVLNKKQGLSTDAAFKICDWLELSPAETDFLILLLKLSIEKNEAKQLQIQSKINSFRRSHSRKQLELNVFEQIANVKCLTTFLLMDGKYKLIDASELSNLINTDIKTSTEILETLERCNLISKVKNKYQRNDDASVLFESKVPNLSLRSVYKEMLLASMDSIQNGAIEDRTIGCEFILIDKDQLPKIQKIIDDCFNKVVNLSHQAKIKDHVYNLGIQLTKITKG